MPQVTPLIFICAFSCLCSLSAQDKFTYSGYTKNLVSAIHLRQFGTSWDNLVHNRAMFEWQADTAWSVRGDLRSRLFFGDLAASPLFDAMIEAGANDIVDLSMGTRIGDRGYVHSYFDRLYVQYRNERFEARAGRQRINWGINTLWNPNDIFNAYAFTDFDYEERPGSDAIRLRYFTGELSSIEVVGKLGNTMRDGAAAMLWKSHLGTYDLQFLGGYLTESGNIVLGGGWAGNLKNWGFKGEASVFVPLEDEDPLGAAVSMGWDYVFAGGVLLGFGGLYNAQGRTSGGLEELFAFELSARNLYPFRWTINASMGVSFHPLINGSFTAVYSIAGSHPVFLSPAVSWSVAEDIDIDVVGQFVFQKSGKDFISPVQAGFFRVKWSY